MATITLETLRTFVIKHGDLKVVDLSGTTRMLQPNVPDYFDAAEKATSFCYEGKWYTREAFAKLMEAMG